jgi:hypothetical protein
MSKQNKRKAKKLSTNLYTNDFFTTSAPTRQSCGSRSPDRNAVAEATILRIARSRRSLRDRASGGAGRDRTDDILLAKQALSQLSYGP